MRSRRASALEPSGANGASREPAAVPLYEAFEDVADAARRVATDQLELVLVELRDAGTQWLRALVLVRAVLPLAGLGWLAAMAALVVTLARKFDWPAAFLVVSALNLCLAALLGGFASRHVRNAWKRS